MTQLLNPTHAKSPFIKRCVIIEDRRILRLLDEWVRRIDDRAFVDALPSLRRAMGSWSRASRRALARRLAQGEQADTTDPAGDDEELLAFAAPVLATVGTIPAHRQQGPA